MAFASPTVVWMTKTTKALLRDNRTPWSQLLHFKTGKPFCAPLRVFLSAVEPAATHGGGLTFDGSPRPPYTHVWLSPKSDYGALDQSLD